MRCEETGRSFHNREPLSDAFLVHAYKVLPCKRKYSHDWASCPCAHQGERAARRDWTAHAYQAIACRYGQKKLACPAGDACPFAHNLFEYWLHPQRFRTELCQYGPSCKRPVCFFAHGAADLRPLDPALPPPEVCWAAGAALGMRAVQSSWTQQDMQQPQQQQQQLQQPSQLGQLVGMQPGMVQLQPPPQLQLHQPASVPLQQARTGCSAEVISAPPLMVSQSAALVHASQLGAGWPPALHAGAQPVQRASAEQLAGSGSGSSSSSIAGSSGSVVQLSSVGMVAVSAPGSFVQQPMHANSISSQSGGGLVTCASGVNDGSTGRFLLPAAQVQVQQPLPSLMQQPQQPVALASRLTEGSFVPAACASLVQSEAPAPAVPSMPLLQDWGAHATFHFTGGM